MQLDDLYRIVSRDENGDSILTDSQAEIRPKIEQDIVKVLVCLDDSYWDVQKAALNAIGNLVQYRE
jgi:hypothetical protein